MRSLLKLSLLSLTVAAALYSQAPVQQLPATGDMYKMLDMSDPYRTTISGLFAQPMEFLGGKHQLHVYIGAENRQSEPFVLLLVDSDTEVPAFLQASGWRQLADEQGLIVAVAQPPGESWNGEADLAYLEAVYTLTHNRSHYNAQKGNN